MSLSSQPLSGKQRRFLRGLGHGLKPVVHVGKQGLTPPLLVQLSEALDTHELVKVRFLETLSATRKEAARALAAQSNAELVQVLGRTALLYRPHEESPVIVLPAVLPSE